MSDAMLALRISNAIAIVLLFLGGYNLAKYPARVPGDWVSSWSASDARSSL